MSSLLLDALVAPCTQEEEHASDQRAEEQFVDSPELVGALSDDIYEVEGREKRQKNQSCDGEPVVFETELLATHPIDCPEDEGHHQAAYPDT